jgi:hypothetical protein
MSAVAVSLVLASTAYAEGYNRGLLIPAIKGWGGLSDDSRLQYQGVNILSPGPHGGYTTTTNKCQDCHSTHYAYGSYKLTRASEKAAVCDFCHTGGGGANTNIMMDNAYTTTAAEMAVTGGPAADSTTTSGFGTGHTLGYQGNAPADIRPAYSTESFSCFDCHTPHGNSARALTTFFAPGRQVRPTPLTTTYHLLFDDNTLEITEVVRVDRTGALVEEMEYIPLAPPGREDEEFWIMAWGIESSVGNIVVKYDFAPVGGLNFQPVTYRKPIFPTGRFLLLKNPDNENGLGLAGDMSTATVGIGGRDVVTDGNNKLAIDWNNALGPAMTYDVNYAIPDDIGMPVYYTGNDERFPFPLFITGTGQDRPGIATVGEFCTDCHDGTAGLATQAAEVWVPAVDDYMVAYSHDAQPRTCDRQMIMNSDDDNNFGPDCRSCHSGAASCSQCHADTDIGSPLVEIPLPLPLSPDLIDPGPIWDTEGYPEFTEGKSTYKAQPSLKTVGPEAFVNLPDAACVDGGFSFPHRTLGVNMLKDSLWGVDFDGRPVAPGEVRNSSTLDDLELRWSGGTGDGAEIILSYDVDSLAGQAAHNLDSECIDCHNPDIWSGKPKSEFGGENFFASGGYRVDGAATEWEFGGWELLLKGLP